MLLRLYNSRNWKISGKYLLKIISNPKINLGSANVLNIVEIKRVSTVYSGNLDKSFELINISIGLLIPSSVTIYDNVI